MVLNNCQINLRADTAANWSTNNPQLAANEIGIDLTNYEIKIGTSANWSNTQNFIANNTTVKAIQATANQAISMASGAQQTASNAASLAGRANEFRESMLSACFPAYAGLYEETLFSDTKLNQLEKIAKLCANNSQDPGQCRVTDTVTIDLLYALIGIIFKEMGKGTAETNNILDTFFGWWKGWVYNAPVTDEYIKLEQMKS